MVEQPEIRFYTAQETAKILRLQYWTTLKLLASGKIHGHQIGKKWRVSVNELNRLAEAGDKR